MQSSTPGTTTTLSGDLTSSISCDGTNCVISFNDGASFTCLQTGNYVQCRGIPYVQAPTGNRRWRASELITSYAGQTFDNTQYKPMCPGDNWNNNGQFSEDCLFVNIHFDKSKFEAEELAPVIYYIHGGGFSGGSNRNTYNSVVLDQGAMVIDVAYRLGIYGFLWSPTPESSNPAEPYQGNWGLIDQTQALAWGSIFAKHFGGDASEVRLVINDLISFVGMF